MDHTGALSTPEARMLSRKQKESSGSALTGQGVEDQHQSRARVFVETLRVRMVTQCGGLGRRVKDALERCTGE